MALYRAIATVGGWTMGSRILGFVRDVLIANVLGAGLVTDAFFIAFKFPNLFRRLFGEGAMNAAFVPLYSRRLERGPEDGPEDGPEEGPEVARAFAGEVASVLTLFMIALTILAMGAMPWIMSAIAPGFRDDPAKFALTVELGRIAFPYLLFMTLSALLAGVLNAHGRFAAAAAAPILLNVVLISALVLIHLGAIPAPGPGLAYGVALAGALQFAMLALAAKKAGVLPRVPRPRLTPGVRRLVVLMVPGVAGAGVVQINVMIGDVLASFLAEGSVSYLYYADRVNQLPLGVIGVAVGIALLPLLSRQLKAGETEAAAGSMNRALEISLLLTLPAAAALIAIPDAIVVTLFERGAFGPEAAAATADALRAFAIGLPAYVLIKALSPGFWAREDTKTPVQIAAAAVILNVALALALMGPLAHAGIALATAVTAWANAGALALLLHRRGLFRADARLAGRVPRMLLAAALMAAALTGGALLLEPWLAPPGILRIPALAVLVGGGALVYFAAGQLFGAARLGEVTRLLRRPAAKTGGEGP
ncbi:MAG: murein biosynthesis integral membrane protein MurJ [Alphaproteobacteria bacterium]|nr:murein biosynthesis integral membrane protein MurJ [Alphaproteobacteria bacterium]